MTTDLPISLPSTTLSAPAFVTDYEALTECNETVLNKPTPQDGRLYCNATFDGWLCFDYTPAGSNVYRPCPVHMHPGFLDDAFAVKQCMPDGRWFRHPYTQKVWTDYRPCSSLGDKYNIIMMYISGYSLSIVLLFVSIIIFNLFRHLKCNRVTLHQHLFVSYILTGLFWIVYYTQVSMQTDVVHSNPTWCQALHVITQYITLCNYCWMLCEGFYLHTIIVLTFTKEKVLLWICFIFGWGFPLIPTLVYAGLRSTDAGENTQCWLHTSTLLRIIMVPVIVSLLINVVFLANILRILFSKLRAFNTNESHQNRRAVRAILILIPLLGIQYLALLVRPDTSPQALYIFDMLSALLVSYQGVCVALIFCFFNGEVMTVFRRKWNEWRNHQNIGNFDQRRSFTHTTGMWDDPVSTTKNGGPNGARLLSKPPQETTEMQSIMKYRD